MISKLSQVLTQFETSLPLTYLLSHLFNLGCIFGPVKSCIEFLKRLFKASKPEVLTGIWWKTGMEIVKVLPTWARQDYRAK